MRRLKFTGAALLAIMATYVAANKTGERTPIQLPANAIALPWPKSDSKVFVTPSDQHVNCGHFDTFLGDNLYDDSIRTAGMRMTFPSYEEAYDQLATPSAVDAAAMRLAQLAMPAGQVTLCPSGPIARQ